MSDPVISIHGQVIRDLCETLGVMTEDVYLIEIRPASVVVHEFRREGDLIVAGDGANVLRRQTDIRIDWAVTSE